MQTLPSAAANFRGECIMDGGTEYLKLINLHIQNLIEQKKREIEVENKSLKRLFDLGCGFTEFLTQMFCYLDFSEVQNCRLVSTKWKQFVDDFVFEKHPAITNYYSWTDGSVDNARLFCGGEVRLVCSDVDFIYCAMKDGAIMVFDSQTFIFVKVLEESECFFLADSCRQKCPSCHNRSLCCYLVQRKLESYDKNKLLE